MAGKDGRANEKRDLFLWFAAACVAIVGAFVFFQIGWMVRHFECQQEIEAKLKRIHENREQLDRFQSLAFREPSGTQSSDDLHER